MTKNREDLLLELIQKNYHPNFKELRNRNFFYTGKVSLSDLSEIFQVPTSEIVAFFWQKGQKITKFQALTPELINSYCQSRGVETRLQKRANFNEIINDYLIEIDKNQVLLSSPLVVSIMGHIDHGKTTLLDTIQQTQKQKKEAGGITQKISVSRVEFRGQKITFCDTPGHGVFIQMRQQGVSLANLIVLVISAEDGIMTQTVEIIRHIHQYNLPVIAFINHKKSSENKNEANLQKIKSQLQKQNLVPADWGGETIVISGSAKEEKDVKNLLEILLENFNKLQKKKTNYQRSADGVVIDSYLNPKSGIVNILLIQGGQLKVNDWIFTNGREGRVKRMLNEHNKLINEAFPGEPIWVFGLDFCAEAGEKFLVVNNQEIRQKLTQFISHQLENEPQFPSSNISFDEKKKTQLNLIICADTQASLESLAEVVRQSSTSSVDFRLLYKSIGNLKDQVLDLAKINQSIIVFFNIKLNETAKQKLKKNNISWFSSEVIYHIEKKLKELAIDNREKKQIEEELGKAEVIKIFYFSKVGNIAGCKVTSGKINRNHLVNVLRKREKLSSAGRIRSLESKNSSLSEVREGQECAIVLNNFSDFQVGDQIVTYRIIEENETEKK